MVNPGFEFKKLDKNNYLIDGKEVIVVDETSNDLPMVSVTMITHNHSKFIKQAIEGVLMQQTNFKVVLVIGEDCSSDETREIVTDYQRKHKDKIILKLPQYNLAININSISNKLFCKGKYIAECEGDDYWIDPLKLQKQVDFLEKNCDFSMACNSSSEINENGQEFKIAKRNEDIIDLAMVLKEGWFIRTASIVFRREAIKDGFPDFFFKAYSTDYILQVMLLKTGLCKYFPEVMSAYRHHQGGISQANKKSQVERWITKIELLDTLNDFTNFKYNMGIIHHQKSIKQTISYYLYRNPSLLKDVGPKVYFQKGSLGRLFKEVCKRLNNRLISK